MYILGVSAFYHDSSACLIEDGEIIAAAQEERFTRVKGESRFPCDAINFCLEKAGIGLKEIPWVVYYENPFVKFERLTETYASFWPKSEKLFSESFPVWADKQLHISSLIKKELGNEFAGRVVYTDHHLSHAASAFFPSPFKDAAILTVDAVGEWSTSTIGIGEGNRVNLLQEVRFPHSVGLLYSAFTFYAGFRVNSGEYKLMGLAPYGEPVYSEIIRSEVVTINDNGSIKLNMEYFSFAEGDSMTSEKFHNLFGGAPRKPDDFITQKDMDIAASIQSVTEEIMVKSAQHAFHITGKRNLVLAGGVALNCVANGLLKREGPFENVWVQPAAGDAGGSLGAALLFWYHHIDVERVPKKEDAQKGSYLGPEFNATEIEAYLDSVGANYDRYDNEEELLDFISERIANGEVVGWFNGRMEFGPRALGARSIIGDPRSDKMQQTMNLKIKNRESFRPFAPCVLKEYAQDYFEMNNGDESPYMLMVCPVRTERRTVPGAVELEIMKDPDLTKRVSLKRSDIPAVTHVDYSARVQTVTEERNGRFYRLMKKFYQKTGCPVIVNTSFNVRGEPIVCSPEHAYNCFMATEMDCLVIENYLLLKEIQPSGLIPELTLYKKQMQPD